MSHFQLTREIIRCAMHVHKERNFKVNHLSPPCCFLCVKKKHAGEGEHAEGMRCGYSPCLFCYL